MRRDGFTLIEVMVVVAIVSLMATVSFGVYKSVQQKNDLAVTVFSVVGALRQAETFARTEKNNSAWGVKVTTSTVIIFMGSSYASRTESSDVVQSLPNGLSISGTNEAVFSKGYGVPAATGTIGITSVYGSKTITINSEGMVAY